MVKPKRIVKDVSVMVNKFIIPTDFIILDMEKNKGVPIILERPFLATGDVVMGVRKISITFRVNSEEVTFDANPQENGLLFHSAAVRKWQGGS